MINETIKALRQNKLHEAVLRISQFNISKLQKLLVAFLIDDYAKYYNKKKDEAIEYRFDFPDAYSMIFRLYKEKRKWKMSIFLNYDELFDLELTEDNNIILSDEFAEITLEKETRKWVLSSIVNKKNIYKIIKNV